MKFYILPVLILFSSLNLVSQSINWVTMDKALELQKNTPKNIMIDIYTTWCGPCKMLDKNTFTNKDLITFVNANYYAVKFNAEGNESVNYKNRLFENPNYDPAKAKQRADNVKDYEQKQLDQVKREEDLVKKRADSEKRAQENKKANPL